MSEINNILNDLYGTAIKTKENIRDLQSKFTGGYGEELTSYYLKDSLKGNYKIVKNVYIPIGNKFTELDSVLIHEKGIFVIESKNYGGWIFGDEKSEKWCQTFATGDKYMFYNPIKQNSTHCNALSKMLNISEEKIKSYIVFSERCSLKKVPKDNDRLVICKRNEMLLILDMELSNKCVIYNSNQLEIICNLLMNYTGKKYQEVHKQQIKKFNEGDICPKCGRKLVIRNGAYNKDDFIGCSGYPNCRFTRSITSKDLKLFGVEWDIKLFVDKNSINSI